MIIGAIEGYLLYFSDLYIFQPYDYSTTRILQKDRNLHINERNDILQNVIKISKDINIDRTGQENILNILESRISEIQKYNIDHHINNENIVYDYVIDRLNSEEFNLLFKQLIKIDIDIINQNDKIMNILNSFKRMGIYIDNYIFDIFDGQLDKIYIINFKEKKFTQGTKMNFIECYDKDEYKKFLKRVENSKKTIENNNGYMDFSKKNIIQFKIIGSDKKSTGAVCGTGKMKREDYIKIIKNIKNNFEDNKSIKSKTLCILIELFLRAKSEKTFIRPYESLMIRK
jgi:hypothetical protein